MSLHPCNPIVWRLLWNASWRLHWTIVRRSFFRTRRNTLQMYKQAAIVLELGTLL